MNRQNYNPEEIANYPLTIERMAEMQRDQQVALEIVARAAGRDCIVSGLESAGRSGYVVIGGEVLEVKAQSGLFFAAGLRLRSQTISAENSDGEEVEVREERWLEWVSQVGGEGVIDPGSLPRVEVTLVEESQWEDSENEEIWDSTPYEGRQLPRVRKRKNGLVEIEMDCKWSANAAVYNIQMPAGYIPYRVIELPVTLTIESGGAQEHYYSQARLSASAGDENGSHLFIPLPQTDEYGCQQIFFHE